MSRIADLKNAREFISGVVTISRHHMRSRDFLIDLLDELIATEPDEGWVMVTRSEGNKEILWRSGDILYTNTQCLMPCGNVSGYDITPVEITELENE